MRESPMSLFMASCTYRVSSRSPGAASIRSNASKIYQESPLSNVSASQATIATLPRIAKLLVKSCGGMRPTSPYRSLSPSPRSYRTSSLFATTSGGHGPVSFPMVPSVSKTTALDLLPRARQASSSDGSRRLPVSSGSTRSALTSMHSYWIALRMSTPRARPAGRPSWTRRSKYWFERETGWSV